MQARHLRFAKVYLTKEKETLLITLYLKALESRSEKPILGNETAESLIRQIDCDYRKFKVRRDDQVLSAAQSPRTARLKLLLSAWKPFRLAPTSRVYPTSMY